MEKLQEVLQEYGMVFKRISGQEEYAELVEQEIRWMNAKNAKSKKGTKVEDDFREIVGNLFVRGRFHIVDLEKFSSFFDINYEGKQMYPLWFFEVFDISVSHNIKRTKLDVSINYQRIREVLNQQFKSKELENVFLDKMSGTNALERVFLKEEIYEKTRDQINREVERFANKFYKNKDAGVLRFRIIKALQNEFQNLLIENSEVVS